MTNYKVSVIIPTYNAQDTIRRAVDSVINQTIGFSNIELIIYDDKSTDNTREILKEYAGKHDNIVLVLADENSGYPGKGRNEGIRIASSDYIMFMDNDDEYLPDMCKTLYDEIVEENADMVSSNYLNIDKISSKIIVNSIKGGGVKSKYKEIFFDDKVYDFQDTLIWSKIFRKSVIIQNNVKFPENRQWEDMLFIYLFLLYANKVVYLKEYTGYMRHDQKDSLGKQINYLKSEDMIGLFSNIIAYKDNKDFSWLSSGNIRFSLMHISNILDDKKELNELLNYLYEFENKTEFDDSHLEIIYKIPNKLIMKKQFKMVIAYFKITRKLYKSQTLRKIYRKLK